ncbi:beta-lactamase family protein [Planctomonas sp. JC2975]|uniref:serine hydrolase domain-containing protein n=1 Tax=Planctomonas sp. JC2975 TaxID=2729626 RepID=UPI00147484AB|nr:serine hydrolase domain-containing protein [Planctomonas sp. JC2975]NNC12463.1 beta-lactamase family protein [Planctomonas sp. JC2975]
MSGLRGRTRRSTLIAAAVAVVLGASAFLSGCTSQTNAPVPSQASVTLPADEAAAVKKAVTDAMGSTAASGAIVGVWAPWAGSYTAGIGTTTAKGKQAVTSDMAWRVGSVTKPMTCTVLLSLVQKGRVALDDPVTKYLPRLVGVDGLTLGQLCQNTSGLGDYTSALNPQFVDNPQRPYVPMELVASGLGEPRTGTPGQAWSYSNAGFILLGMALQAATGEDWTTLYRNEVFQPLGMSSSSLPAGTSIPGSALHGYATSLDAVTGSPACGTVVDDTQVAPTATWTASGVVSTLSDLKTFAQAFATSSLLRGDAKKAAWKTVPMGTTVAGWQTYGMGGLQLGPMRGHDGSAPGFITSMLSDPASGLTIVVMLNDSTSGAAYAQALAMQLAAIATTFKPVEGRKAPTITLPWNADAAAASLNQLATCRPAGAPPAPTPTPEPTPPPAVYRPLPSN